MAFISSGAHISVVVKELRYKPVSTTIVAAWRKM
jgi:hypothetical protein